MNNRPLYPQDILDRVLCGNAAEMLKLLPNDSIDLTVTSPPYGELRDYNGYEFDYKPIADELYRVTKTGGVVVWVVNDATIGASESGESFRQALYFKDNAGFLLHDTMIYWKSGVQKPVSNRCHQVFEYMFVFSKGPPKTFNILCDRPNKYRRSGKGVYRHRSGEIKRSVKSAKYGELGRRFNIWYYKVGKGHSATEDFAYKHPALFPEELARDHIICWSNPDDIVLDPMCGSGTTLKMAKIQKRHYIGFDISPEYCRLTKKRLAQRMLVS